MSWQVASVVSSALAGCACGVMAGRALTAPAPHVEVVCDVPVSLGRVVELRLGDADQGIAITLDGDGGVTGMLRPSTGQRYIVLPVRADVARELAR